MSLQPNYNESWQFLQRFHPGRLVVITGISTDKKQVPTETFAPNERERFLKWVEAAGKSDCNIYFSVGEPMARATKKLERSDIKAVHWLHVDVDPRVGEDIDTERTRILALLRAPSGLPEPTAIIYSGGGYQAYWRLSEPIDISGSVEAAEDAKLYNLQIERTIGADNCHDVSRIMRVPGTINLPDAKKAKKGRVPTLSEVVEFHEDRSYSISRFTKATPLATEVPKGAAKQAAAPKNVVRLKHIDDLGDKVSDKCKVVIVQGTDPDDPGRWPSRSEPLLWVTCELMRSGVDDDAIYSVLTDPQFGISESVVEKGGGMERYALRQIDKAHREIENSVNDWIESDKGVKIPCQHNVRVFLNHEGIRVSYNEFSDRYLIDGLPKFGPSLDDKAMVRTRILAAEKYSLYIPKEVWVDYVEDLALNNRFHPVREYLDTLQWDGIPRLDSWLIKYGEAPDNEYVRAVSALVLVAAVRRIYEPGCKFDEMMVLEGQQGKNKSTALAVLAVKEEWFGDDLPLDSDTKRFIEAIAGKWIVEAGELKGMRKGEVDSLKSTLSRRRDRARMSYGRQPVEYPRQCVIIGSTNEKEYLRDMTGNRRFWPISCGTFNVEGLRSVRDQLWAEACLRHQKGESIRLDPKLYSAAGAEQEERRVNDPMEELLEEHLGERTGKVRAQDVWAMIGKADAGRRSQDDMNRLGAAMRRLGWERSKRRFDGKVTICYLRGSDSEREQDLFVQLNDITGAVESISDLPNYATNEKPE